MSTQAAALEAFDVWAENARAMDDAALRQHGYMLVGMARACEDLARLGPTAQSLAQVLVGVQCAARAVENELKLREARQRQQDGASVH